MNSIELSNHIRSKYKPSMRSMTMRGLVHGKGINDADYMQQPVTENGRITCPAYRAWKSMLARAYYERFHKLEPTYADVEVCESWLKFMRFREWWVENYKEGFHLDKDLFGDGKEYSPDKCIYIPQWLNAFIMAKESMRGKCLIGVNINKRSGKYIAQSSNPINGKREFIGHFDDMEEASKRYKTRKKEHANSLKPYMDEIDSRIFNRVIMLIEESK